MKRGRLVRWAALSFVVVVAAGVLWVATVGKVSVKPPLPCLAGLDPLAVEGSSERVVGPPPAMVQRDLTMIRRKYAWNGDVTAMFSAARQQLIDSGLHPSKPIFIGGGHGQLIHVASLRCDCPDGGSITMYSVVHEDKPSQARLTYMEWHPETLGEKVQRWARRNLHVNLNFNAGGQQVRWLDGP